MHSSQIGQDDLFLTGGIFASVQDENDRDGGIRSMLITLRDGYIFNIIFDSYRKLENGEYEECTTSDMSSSNSHQILRFDEIIDGNSKFDTELELQDRVSM